MAVIPPGKGGDWVEREAWMLNPPSMSDRDLPRPPGGTFVNEPIPSDAAEIPRGASSDFATRDVYLLVDAGGTPQAPIIDPPPEPEALNPWDGMTRHDQLNDYIGQANITPTDEWTTMTIADKKAWLTENYAK